MIAMRTASRIVVAILIVFASVMMPGRRAVAQERAPEIKIPLFCIQGAADKIAQAAASEHFVARAGSADKEYVSLPDHYHEVLNEPDRAITMERVATTMLRWGTAIPAGTER